MGRPIKRDAAKRVPPNRALNKRRKR